MDNKAFFWKGLIEVPRHCQSFGTILNLLVDRYPDLEKLSPEIFLRTFVLGSVTDFNGRTPEYNHRTDTSLPPTIIHSSSNHLLAHDALELDIAE